ncbi:hypothetical protein KUF83_08070 [Streptomyces sp. BV286]|uniref:hypothetical protein n=1 Tax=Streptomyces sp. BV286 TaxID=2849672 RepID=UPI001C2E4C0B|nr:hypothetical protein [Streptomyces sp. BV286]MBV1936520.1 hypothetical protein [Streptomyces sp. BV286]
MPDYQPLVPPSPVRKRNRTVLIVVALVVAAGVGSTVWAFARTTYDEHVANCEKALTSAATKMDRPDACEALSQDDYDTLHMAWVMQNAFDEMPKKERDTLDYYDDGSINGSLD